MSRPRLFVRSALGVALALFVPLAGCVIVEIFYPDVIFAHVPLHSLFESLGGLAALAIAAILMAERERRESHDFYVCMAVALMGMGVLDAFHAATEPGNSFVWLHTLATFVGGALFATVWCPSEWLRGTTARWSPLLIVMSTAMIGVLSIAYADRLPPMIAAGEFTRAARFLNFAGGAGFLVAGSFFILRYHRHHEEEDWLFAVHTVLFGAAGLLFEFSALWDLAWWWWHILRLAAYVVALVYAARKFWEAERVASLANRQLAELNRSLDDLVARRTDELRTTEERYRLSVRGSNDGLWDWNVSTGEVFYSSRFRDLLGYTEEEFPNLFESFESRLHPDDHAHTLAAVEAHLQRHEPYDVEYRLKTRDDEYRWFRARGQALWNEAGQATRMAGSITDVTDRKQAEMALQHERFLLQTLLSNLPDAIYFKDLEGRFLRVSDSLARHLGVNSPAEVHGKTDADFFPPLYAAQARADELEMQTTGEPLRAKEEHPQWVNGTDSYVLTTKHPLREPTGEIIGTFGISRDITSVKEAQATLVRAKEAAEAANRAKSDFLANMSHEIRTPMNAIIGMTELVLDTRLSQTQHNHLTTVLESAESLLSIINQILDFSKIEAGKLELEHVDFDLREEVGDTLKSLALRAHSQGLELAWQVHSDVPHFLRGDPVRLRQILVNLVGNAIKFTPRGEVVVEVNAEAITEPLATLHFQVRDTGIGIPPDKQETVFAAFQQADTSTTRQYGGTGLGLTISTCLVEAMRGRIWLDSEMGTGSTFHFTVTLPMVDGLPHAGEWLACDLHDFPIMVVDDNATNRHILEEMLENWGLRVCSTACGPQALETLRDMAQTNSPLPILLTDVNMPDMDGFELVQKVRSTEELCETEVIMLTSGGRPGDGARCEELGVSAHIMKPVKQSELLEAIVRAAAPHLSSALARERASAGSTNGNSLGGENPREGDRQDAVRDGGHLPSLKILLAEDGLANQAVATALLEKWGHQVTVAVNGKLACEAWQREPFDVILMDVQMPVMDGLEATAWIRHEEACRTESHNKQVNIPIIAMTARAMKGDRERCLAAGMNGYVSKPVRRVDLLRTLASFFSPDADRQPTGTAVDGSPMASDPAHNLDADDPNKAGTDLQKNATTEHRGKLIDWQVAGEYVDNDPVIMSAIIEAAVEELPLLQQRLHGAVLAADATAARRNAHTIKSTARTFGIAPLEAIAGQVEEHAAAENLSAVPGKLDDLDQLVSRTVEELVQRQSN